MLVHACPVCRALEALTEAAFAFSILLWLTEPDAKTMRLCVEILRVARDRPRHLVDCLLQCASSNTVRVVIDRTICVRSKLPHQLKHYDVVRMWLGRLFFSASPTLIP